MKKKTKRKAKDELRAEYDFKSMPNGIRGKYAVRVRQHANVVLLQPDVADAFPTEKLVNEALRGILAITRTVRTSQQEREKSSARRKVSTRKSHP
jgi:hypothetical protein